jgi:hypothetical protein
MNLTLEVNGRDVELWQTPTYITYMCLMDANGKYSTKTELLEAKRAVHCYLTWINSTTNGVWDSSQEHEEARATVNRHVKEVLQELESAKTIEVSLI